MSISVKLTAFEGPLDLLLHLIDKNKVNIYDIPIVEITEQYLSYIRQMEERNLDLMSEFLVMAATLIQIKSKMLLPQVKDEEDDDVDPRQALVERLLEYKKYKFVSEELREKQLDAAKNLFKKPTIPDEVLHYEEEIPVELIMKDVSLTRLYAIFKGVVKKQVDKVDPIRSKFGEIKREAFSVQDKIAHLRGLLKINKKLSFRKILETSQSKQEIIANFLAVLELIKMGDIHIFQEDLFDDIVIKAKVF